MRCLHVIILLLLTCSVSAQVSSSLSSKEKRKAVAMHVDNRISQLTKGSFDPEYVTRPQKNWRVTLSGNKSYSTYGLKLPIPAVNEFFAEQFPGVDQSTIPGLSRLSHYVMDLSSSKKVLQLGVHYRGLGAKININLDAGSNQSYHLEYLGAKMGGLLEYRRSTRMKGTMFYADTAIYHQLAYNYKNGIPYDPDKILRDNTRDIIPAYNNYTLLHAQVHYVFNSRHFCYSASRTAFRVQKRSAGSFIALADYYQTRAYFKDGILLHSAERFRVGKGAIGLGYGYNYTPNEGKLLVHLSLIPSANFYSRSSFRTSEATQEEYDAKYGSLLPSDPRYLTFEQYLERDRKQVDDVTNAINRNSHFNFNLTGRLSVVYQLSPTIVLGTYGTYQHIRHSNHQHFSIDEQDLRANFFVGYRF